MKETKRAISVISALIRTIVIVGVFICTVFTTSAESETVTFEGKTATEKALTFSGIGDQGNQLNDFIFLSMRHRPASFEWNNVSGEFYGGRDLKV